MFPQKDLSFIYKYFAAEKQFSFAFIIIGSVAVLLSVIVFFFIKTNPSFFKGLAVPLFAFGMLQAIASFTVYSRTDKQVKDVAYKIGMEPARFVSAEELPRMQKVMKTFSIIKWVEIILLIGGIVLLFYFKNKPQQAFWYGLGITLAIQCAIMFAADSVAENSAKKYLGGIEKFVA